MFLNQYGLTRLDVYSHGSIDEHVFTCDHSGNFGNDWVTFDDPGNLFEWLTTLDHSGNLLDRGLNLSDHLRLSLDDPGELGNTRVYQRKINKINEDKQIVSAFLSS